MYPDGGAWEWLIHVNPVYIRKIHHNIHCNLAEGDARRKTGEMAGTNGCNRTGWIAAAADGAAAGGRTGRDSRHKMAAGDDSFVCNRISVRLSGMLSIEQRDKQAYGYWCCGGYDGCCGGYPGAPE